MKGLGGFQLACRADDAVAVTRLRTLKRRPSKPFAVMLPTLAAARTVVRLEPQDEILLRSPQAPILLARRRPSAVVTAAVAPGVDDLGVMLPTTPLHGELFREAQYPALVMTSGNVTDEPICRGNREALSRLGPIADLLLLHDRDVVHRIDDSVMRATPRGPVVIRRSRGWVPEPLPLPDAVPEPVLALGGHLQTTACLAVGGEAFPSQHVGDLDTEAARDFLVEVAGDLERFMEVQAGVLAADLHPDYPSTWIAERLAAQRGGRVLRVQHHLAHAAAVLAEHAAFPAGESRCAALILDGTGWGTDGTAWGCELLLLDGALRWRRLAHATPLPLDRRRARRPRAVARRRGSAGCRRLRGRARHTAACRGGAPGAAPTSCRARGPRARGRSPPGRDGYSKQPEPCAVSPHRTRWEGEAAARFEALAGRCAETVPPWPEVARSPNTPELPTASLLVAAARRLLDGEPRDRVAAGFHATFCRLAAALAARAGSW